MNDNSKFLGHCQACGRLQALHVNSGRIAKHGYTVDYGFFNGKCRGGDQPVLEHSRELLDNTVAGLYEYAVGQEQLAEALSNGTREPWFSKPGPNKDRHGRRIDVVCERSELPEYEARRQFESLISRAKWAAESARKDAAFLLALAASVHGKPLIPRPPEEAKPVVGPGTKFKYGDFEYTVIREGVDRRSLRHQYCWVVKRPGYDRELQFSKAHVTKLLKAGAA